MYRYVYVSEARADLSPKDTESILVASRRNNAAANVSGLLLLHDGRFFQVLEGPTAAVKACYHRIEGDPRHSGIIHLDSGPINARAFPQWRMGFCLSHDLPPEYLQSVVSICDLVRPGTAEHGHSPRVRVLIRYFLSQLRPYRLPGGPMPCA